MNREHLPVLSLALSAITLIAVVGFPRGGATGAEDLASNVASLESEIVALRTDLETVTNTLTDGVTVASTPEPLGQPVGLGLGADPVLTKLDAIKSQLNDVCDALQSLDQRNFVSC